MKAKDEEKWIESMRRRMEGYSEPLPDGLWNELEGELNASEVKAIPFWRIWYVAAAVLALLASSLSVWFWTSPAADFKNQDMAVQKAVSLPAEQMRAGGMPENQTLPEEALADASPRRMKKDAALRPLSPTAEAENASLPHVQSEPETEEARDEDMPASSASPEKQNAGQTDSRTDAERVRKASRAADRKQMRQNAYSLKTNKGNAGKEKFSVGLLAGNMPYSSSNTYNGMVGMGAISSYQVGNLTGAVSDKETALVQNFYENQGYTAKTNIKHHMPVTVGASFRWSWNEDWALETGLTYTMLATDWSSGAKTYLEYDQRLHYVGIPLKVQRSIWKNNRFAFYASAGGAVEKCVSGKLKTTDVNSGRSWDEDMDVDPLQWSVTAAVGAQVNFNPQIGLYVEPGMAYYFDDNSGVETIRKEHPFNFNLQLGLRFSVGR